MAVYKIDCYIPGQSITQILEAEEMTVNEGAYMFWSGKCRKTDKLIASYPVSFTIVKTIEKRQGII